mmetsp:Transcript_54581/g.152279  ORF Transcript_54581/g.152279 Transcript_54581/m.152279 type:complete len:99 (+) Transcript_54581:89-385(+)
MLPQRCLAARSLLYSLQRIGYCCCVRHSHSRFVRLWPLFDKLAAVRVKAAPGERASSFVQRGAQLMNVAHVFACRMRSAGWFHPGAVMYQRDVSCHSS